MNALPETSSLPLDSILHPTDFSRGSEVAFAHALELALLARAELTLLHVEREGAHAHWSAFPAVRQTLERWGLLAPGSPRDAVPKLGISVEKISLPGTDTARAILAFFHERPAQLVVLATHGRDGVPRWLESAVAEPVARGSGAMTLFVRHGVRPFVSLETGAASLRRVLVPVAQEPSPQAAVTVAGAFAAALGAPSVTLLHAGDEAAMPAVRLPAARERWERVARPGAPVEAILALAQERAADLVVMSTRGRHGFLDALRGSTTEQVLRRAPCPVLAVPAG